MRTLKDNPWIGLLVPEKAQRKQVLQLYLRHIKIPLKLIAFTPADILREEQRIAGLSQIGGKWVEGVFPFPAAVYNRCYNKNRSIIQRLEEVLGRGRCFNSVNWFNKWKVYALLKQSALGQYLPETVPWAQANLGKITEKHRLIFLKPAFGNQGKSVYRVELKKNGEAHISQHSLPPCSICRKNEDLKQKLLPLVDQDFIVQQGIESTLAQNCHFDIRALVQKNSRGMWTVSAKSCRLAHELYFNTSAYRRIFDANEFFSRILPLGRQRKSVLQSIDDISVKAAEVLDGPLGTLGELSADFLLDSAMNLWLVELNGKPQKCIYSDIKNFRHEALIYSRPLHYALFLAQR
ncbi:MAG TPA: YheC/YheD family protein [Bacillota bacterium]|nr:YheC/YheD family protein [Bacillota bacterium]